MPFKNTGIESLLSFNKGEILELNSRYSSIVGSFFGELTLNEDPKPIEPAPIFFVGTMTKPTLYSRLLITERIQGRTLPTLNNFLQEFIMGIHVFNRVLAAFFVLGSCLPLSLVEGQEPSVQPLSVAGEVNCSDDKCDFIYDEGGNVYVLTSPCKSKTCYCPIPVIATNEAGGDSNPNQQVQKADYSIGCAPMMVPAENQIFLTLTAINGTTNEDVNLKLEIQDPTKKPGVGKDVNFQVKDSAGVVKWDIKLTYKPGAFDEHRVTGNPANPNKTGVSGLRYEGGSSFDNFSHYMGANKCEYEFKKKYKVEVYRR